MKNIYRYNYNAVGDISVFFDEKFSDNNYISISTAEKKSNKKVIFTLNIFELPNLDVEDDIVFLIMSFDGFYEV